MTALVALEDVGVTYRAAAQPALTGVTLGVDAGELVLLAGPSGCGKSTVIRAVNGLVPRSYRAEVTGRITIDGQDAKALSIREIATTVGTLVQDPAKQVVGHSVLADMAFGLENRGVSPGDIRTRIDAVAETLGFTDGLLDASTHELSGGQLQLVAFAGVLILEPRLILVDEPLANLDPAAAARLLRAIRRYVDGGGAALIIEHRVDEIISSAPDRVVYLEQGGVGYSGAVEGFLRVADSESVKLPFAELVSRADTLPPRPVIARRPRGGVRVDYRGAELGYASTPIVRDVTVSLNAGERVAVLGRNGAGKSTLLRAAVGLVDTLGGRVELVGRPVVEYRAAELAALCGYLFQNPAQALFTGTVAEELAFGPRNCGRSAEDVERLSDEALVAVGLQDEPDILSRPPRTLSFGQQRRLALALALTLEPRILILDEPTAGQDERTTNHFLDAIWALSNVDSIYFITHDVDLALWRTDRVIVVDGGRIAADASPSAIVHDTSLWHSGTDADGPAVLRETDFVRAVRTAVPVGSSVPSPAELAREITRRGKHLVTATQLTARRET